jgi:pimeloyl-ACP methyl ester carboxylesterase
MNGSWELRTSSARRRHGRALFLACERSRTRHQPDHRRRRGPLPDRSGRRAQGHHRSAQSGRGARSGRQNEHRRRGRARGPERQRDPRSTRTTSAPTTSGASQSRRGSCGTTPSRTRCCVTLLPSITTPTQIVAGRHDDPRAMVEQRVPRRPPPQQRDPSLDAGHFAWEQAPDEYGRLLADWVTRASAGRRGIARPLPQADLASPTVAVGPSRPTVAVTASRPSRVGVRRRPS